ncbi:MAG: glycosyltransferase [Gemmatimonadales bacterium]|nr:MAG: glycosyltransferase [Gemmatimonadales bacterium]
MTPALPRVMVFARTPVPGQVKTRLAAEVGAERATRIYQALAAGTVERLRGAGVPESDLEIPWDLEIHFTPPDAGSGTLMRAWLGEGVGFVPQAEGDLGMRMDAAIRKALAGGAPAACVVASDVPDLGPRQVGEAFRALDGGADVVFGPSPDGGYYLVALRSPRASLFRGIPWSTPEVLEQSLLLARREALRVHLLEPLRDVDLAADLPPGFESSRRPIPVSGPREATSCPRANPPLSS